MAFSLNNFGQQSLGQNNFGLFDPTQLSAMNYGAPASGVGSLGSGTYGMGLAAPTTDWTKALATSDASAGSGIFGQLGANIPTAQLALSGIGSLANLWGGMKSLGLAQKQFDYTKQVTDTNLNNSIKSYNTSLSDRAAARAKLEGQTSDDAAAYVAANSLSR